jgi:hypothetical protein
MMAGTPHTGGFPQTTKLSRIFSKPEAAQLVYDKSIVP